MTSILSYTSIRPSKLYFSSSSFSWKELYLICNEQGLVALSFKVPLKALHDDEHRHLVLGKKELKEYFQGLRTDFTVPLSLFGSDFQLRVWNQLRSIPFGRTISYKELADRVSSPGAQRAVGSANGKNPLPIIIPCHRVICASGEVGGYSEGVEMKKQLLALEGHHGL